MLPWYSLLKSIHNLKLYCGLTYSSEHTCHELGESPLCLQGTNGGQRCG